jgi:hypothetical protein
MPPLEGTSASLLAVASIGTRQDKTTTIARTRPPRRQRSRDLDVNKAEGLQEAAGSPNHAWRHLMQHTSPTQFDAYDLVWRLLKDLGHATEAGIALRVRLYLGDFHGR